MYQFFPRHILFTIDKKFKDNRIIILVGARQVGKTNIVKNYLTNFLSKRVKYFYFNLEKPSDLEIWQDLGSLGNFVSQSNASLNEKLLLIIDEFQYLKNATQFFKLIYDEYPNIKILATGSSSIEIHKHLKESLVGRKKVYHVSPLSFAEYLQAIHKEDVSKKIEHHKMLPSQIRTVNQTVFADYLLWGGYPRLAEKARSDRETKKEELSDIYTSYVQKDIKALIGGENILSFNNLVKLLAVQIGNLLNIYELSQTLRIPRYEIEKYLDVLEQTFIIQRLPPFFKNKRKEITKMPKIYFNDTGLANMVIANFGALDTRPNLGAIIENSVLCQLAHMKSITDRFYFWRTLDGAEVDFVWRRDDELIPIEVKWTNFTQPAIPVGLKNFCKKFKGVRRTIIVTKDFHSAVKEGKITYQFIPAISLSNRGMMNHSFLL